MNAPRSISLPRTASVLSLLGAVLPLVLHAQTVNVWLTTADQQKKMMAQAAMAFTGTGTSDNPVIVDEQQMYQTVEGFGASFTDSSAYMMNQVATATAKTATMSNLFTRDGDGIGLSFLRNPMGACDYSRTVYSYDDPGMGVTDMAMADFSISHDMADIIPLMQQALQLNPQITVMATPWSPPAWMKSSGSMIKGTLRTDVYAAFANYLVKYVQAYAQNGVPIHYLSLQNEPLYEPANYPGMLMDAATQVVLMRDYVLPAFATNQLTTKFLVYDHNLDRPDYPDQVMSDPTLGNSAQVAGIAWHGYAGPVGAMLTFANKYPSKGNYLTEHSGGTWVSNQLKSDFEDIIHVMRSSGRAYVKWNLALDENRGPHTGGSNASTPLVTVHSGTGAVTYNIEYYTLGHFSKFVMPGARRVFSTNGAGIVSSAFVNPDGSKVMVAYNDTTTSRTFQVRWGSRQFGYTMPAGAGATFTWSGRQDTGYQWDAQVPIQASSFNSTQGLQTEPCADVQGGYDLGYSDNNKNAVYQNIDFGGGVASVSARIASATGVGTMELRLDNATGRRIAAILIPQTGGWQAWHTVSTEVSGASGVHDLYVVFTGGNGNGIANLNWLQFSTSSLPTAPAIVSSAYTQSVVAGHAVSFHAAVTGYPAMTYQWRVFGNHGSTWTNLADDSNYSGTASDTLTIAAATSDMNGNEYRLVATNMAGSASSAVLTLNVAAAVLTSPNGLAVDPEGNCWVTDGSTNIVEKITAAGSTTIMAGSSGQQGSADGTGTAASFRQPGGMAVDFAGNVYLADTGNSLIRKISSNGVVTTIAGSAANQGYKDGMGTDAWFNTPVCLAVDSFGNLYVADTGNSVIRRITPTGVVTTIAGTAGAKGAVDGTGAAARFNQPAGIAMDSTGVLYVSDTMNQTIRKITPGGLVSTWVGLTGVSGISDGDGANALFNQPMGLTFDFSGNLYVADSGNSSIRVVTPAGNVSTLAGLSSISGLMDGIGSAAWFNLPKDVKFDGANGLYVADCGNAAIRKVSIEGSVSTMNLILSSTGGNSGSSGSTGSGGTTSLAPNPGGSEGGGGAVGLPFFAVLAALFGLRCWRRRRPDWTVSIWPELKENGPVGHEVELPEEKMRAQRTGAAASLV
jgi:O-glycosyl hydrolase/sugar lactone lactonase YvrE